MTRARRRWSAVALLAVVGMFLAAACNVEEVEDIDDIGALSAAHTVATGGFVVVSGDDADDAGHCQGTACGGMYPAILSKAVSDSRSGGTGILAIGLNGSFALSSFQGWNLASNGGPGASVTIMNNVAGINTVNFDDYAVVYLASYERQTSGGLTDPQITALAGRQADFQHYVNDHGGSLVALTQAGAIDAWGFLPVPLTTMNSDLVNAEPTPDLLAIAPGVTAANLSHCCFHNVFTGPSGFSGLRPLAVSTDAASPGFGQPVVLGGGFLSAEICNDGVDNDGDGLIDKNDPDCYICGDGVLDPGEQCDDGNNIGGDGCDGACNLENQPPDAMCEDRDQCNDPGVCYAAITDIGAGSFDPDGDPLTITQTPPGPYSVGQHTVTVTVSDGTAQDMCMAAVEVRDCEAPSIACPASFSAECTSDRQAAITPPPASATDNCSATVSNPGPTSLPLGSSALLYTASDPSGNGASCTTAVTVVDTIAPVISCPAPTTAECTGNSAATVDPGDATASESCTTATVSDPGASSYPLGTTPVPYTASDEAGNQSSCATAVTVEDTIPPDITCPAPIVAECTGSSSAHVTPGDAISSDICTDTTVSGPSAGSYPLGTTVVTYTASDTSSNQSTCNSTIQVVDTTPPVVSVTPPSPLWPPNHKYRTISLADCGIVVNDGCGGLVDPSVSTPTITCVSSDEPDDDNGNGDGHTVDDIVIVDGTTVMVRAEREGTSDGRVYRIGFRVTDAAGNVTTGICPIGVPHDQSGAPAVDSGAVHTTCR